MASPQLETGFLRLSNELAEAIARAPMNGAQHRIVMVVLRECFGRNGGRKVAPLSLRKIAGRTGLSLRWVRRESSRLLRAGVIVRLPGRGLDLYGIVKDYDQWKLQRESQGAEGQNGEGQSAPGGQVAPGEGVNQPPKGRVSRPPRIKKEESLKNISSFDEFWKRYPKKVAKKAAFKIFKKINPSDALIKQILAALERHAASEKWQCDGGKYIPNATTWLNGERWEDELNIPMATNKQLTQADHYRNLEEKRREQVQPTA